MSAPLVPDITFVEEADYERGFSAFFDKEIEPGLSEMESRRIEVLKQRPKRWLLAGTSYIVFIGILYLMLNADSDATEVVFRVFGIAALLITVWVDAPLRAFQSARKLNILPKVVGFFGLSYRSKGSLEWSAVAASDIVPAGDESLMMGVDEVYGEYHGGYIEVVDLTTKVRSGRSTHTLYQGLFITAKFEKPFRGQTVVVGNREKILDISLSVSSGKLHPVTLESNDFNKQFDVYSSDQIEARELLTPDIMLRLLDLSDIHAGAPVRCSYVNQTLYIIIDTTRQFFLPGSIRTSVYDTKDLHDYLKQIHHVFTLVDLLKLNRQRLTT
ncbi:MAG: DUF3137 domain-containing protein [Patescibacteria group bacterium]